MTRNLASAPRCAILTPCECCRCQRESTTDVASGGATWRPSCQCCLGALVLRNTTSCPLPLLPAATPKPTACLALTPTAATPTTLAAASAVPCTSSSSTTVSQVHHRSRSNWMHTHTPSGVRLRDLVTTVLAWNLAASLLAASLQSYACPCKHPPTPVCCPATANCCRHRPAFPCLSLAAQDAYFLRNSSFNPHCVACNMCWDRSHEQWLGAQQVPYALVWARGPTGALFFNHWLVSSGRG